ncbi:hypothetical protein F8M41_003930 [Gigaspora margarita]|uniref:Uncharacterized protein n=1 Tax=Gigaspora margarita TaxID=4874 RepID=A0A8H4A822_GIGMA|nr:hypothetical protein F8M41_003930 [Gigaspora margarita]
METESSPSVFLSEMASSPSVVPSEMVSSSSPLVCLSVVKLWYYSQNHFTICAFAMTIEELKVVIDIKLTEELTSMHERNPATV